VCLRKLCFFIIEAFALDLPFSLPIPINDNIIFNPRYHVLQSRVHVQTDTWIVTTPIGASNEFGIVLSSNPKDLPKYIHFPAVPMLQFAASAATQFKPPPSIFAEPRPEVRKPESSYESQARSQSISRPPSTVPQPNTPQLYRSFSSDSGRGSISSQSSQQLPGLSALASLAANAAAARTADGR
jgi:hypothetical protein